jgi:hypothetical protein
MKKGKLLRNEGELNYMVSTGLNIHQRLDIPLMEKNHVGWVAHELESASADLYRIYNDKKLSRVDKVLQGKIALSYLRQRLRRQIDYKAGRKYTQRRHLFRDVYGN